MERLVPTVSREEFVFAWNLLLAAESGKLAAPNPELQKVVVEGVEYAFTDILLNRILLLLKEQLPNFEPVALRIFALTKVLGSPPKPIEDAFRKDSIHESVIFAAADTPLQYNHFFDNSVFSERVIEIASARRLDNTTPSTAKKSCQEKH